MLFIDTAALLTGFLLDLLLGDPEGLPHIVRGIGTVITSLEKRLYPMQSKGLAGTFLVLLLLFISAGIPALSLYVAWRVSPLAYFVLASILCWQCLSLKCLKSESRRVYGALAANDLPAARTAVSMIVGRDTDNLDMAGVTRAAVETVAENASDGVVAPLFYLMLFGPLGGIVYKAVNTMDSMIGYKNKRYRDFGRSAAKLDDAANYIPARLSALLMIAAAWFCGFDAKSAAQIWRRDRRKHASPNSAQTESVMAGALNVRLAGSAHYFGELVEKPFIGDDKYPVEPADILRAHKLLTATAWFMLAIGLFGRWLVYGAL